MNAMYVVPDATRVEALRKRDHDLRNQLYLISSFAKQAADGVGGARSTEARQCLECIMQCAARAEELLSPAAMAAPGDLS